MVHYNMELLEIGVSEKVSESIFFRDPPELYEPK
jgi:hypothetical protein